MRYNHKIPQACRTLDTQPQGLLLLMLLMVELLLLVLLLLLLLLLRIFAVVLLERNNVSPTLGIGGGWGWRIYFWEACCPITPLQFLPPTLNLKTTALSFSVHAKSGGNGRSEGERGVKGVVIGAGGGGVVCFAAFLASSCIH